MKKLLLVSLLGLTLLPLSITSCNGSIKDGEAIYKNLVTTLNNAGANVVEILSVNHSFDATSRVDRIYISFLGESNFVNIIYIPTYNELDLFLDNLKSKPYEPGVFSLSYCVSVAKSDYELTTKDTFKNRYPGYFFTEVTYKSDVLIGNQEVCFCGMSVYEDTYNSVTNAAYDMYANAFNDTPKSNPLITMAQVIPSGSNWYYLANYIYKANG